MLRFSQDNLVRIFTSEISSSFRILQCNVQSMHKNKAELQRVLTSGEYDAALLSETWTSKEHEKTSKYQISTYHQILDSRYDSYGGAGILLKKDFNFSHITLPTLSDFTQATALKVISLELVLVSIYVSPTAEYKVVEDDLTKIFGVLRPFRKVVLGGDLNAHHHCWGDRTDKRGEVLMQLVDDFNFLILNDGSPTYVPIRLDQTATAIDLTMSSPNIFTDMGWKVLDMGIGGHHLAIEIGVSIGAIRRPTRYVYDQQKINNKLAQLEGNL